MENVTEKLKKNKVLESVPPTQREALIKVKKVFSMI
jgi:hypothetical protein